jgi:hypothetical protein
MRHLYTPEEAGEYVDKEGKDGHDYDQLDHGRPNHVRHFVLGYPVRRMWQEHLYLLWRKRSLKVSNLSKVRGEAGSNESRDKS